MNQWMNEWLHLLQFMFEKKQLLWIWFRMCFTRNLSLTPWWSPLESFSQSFHHRSFNSASLYSWEGNFVSFDSPTSVFNFKWFVVVVGFTNWIKAGKCVVWRGVLSCAVVCLFSFESCRICKIFVPFNSTDVFSV